jgi:hypothetical protein
MFFAACVIGFDSYYIIAPTTCFFQTSICDGSAATRGLFYTSSNFNDIKIPLIKGQLAAGAVMFVLCLVYIIIYIVTAFRVHRAKNPPIIHPQVQNFVPTVSNGVLTAPPAHTHYPPTAHNNGDGRITQIVCPTCNGALNMTVRK